MLLSPDTCGRLIRRDQRAIAPLRGHLSLAVCIIIASGCAARPPGEGVTAAAAAITADELLSGKAFGAASATTPTIETGDVLAVNDDMRAFIAEYVNPDGNNYLRLEQLLRAIITDGTFGLVYGDSTRTASGTFGARTGNCLSFTNMFIAMAREAGLNVRYQEVDIPPDWNRRGDAYVLSRHVNVKVDFGTLREHVVDFNIDDFKSTYDRREISDERAFAHFFSNKGVEQMQAGQHAAAFRLFRQALELDRDFSPAWSNLAALYNRAGEPAYAEAAYLEALRLKSDEWVAMSNLARLYEAQANEPLAEYYRERVRYHRNRNPYYRYSLARQAFLDRDYEGAIEHLEFAVRKKQWEDSFYFLMGLSYLQLGEDDQARHWLEQAESVAASDALKRNYQSKIDLLLFSAPP